MDLTQYIVHRCSESDEDPNSSSRTSLQGKRVLELGCGHGLPGLAAGLAGADLVIFQVLLAHEPKYFLQLTDSMFRRRNITAAASVLDRCQCVMRRITIGRS